MVIQCGGEQVESIVVDDFAWHTTAVEGGSAQSVRGRQTLGLVAFVVREECC